MPALTPDQGLSLPISVDAANNPTAFNNFVAGVEPRLVRMYVDEADRTARMVVLPENAISTLANENRIEVWNTANHVSLYRRSMFMHLRLSADVGLTPSSAVLQNVAGMVVVLPTAGIFRWRSTLFYDASTTADIKFAYTMPAGASMRWGVIGQATSGGTMVTSTTTVSGTAIALGALGVGTFAMASIEGDITMGGTGGNLQLQAAQNTGDATAINIGARSYMEVWRFS